MHNPAILSLVHPRSRCCSCTGLPHSLSRTEESCPPALQWLFSHSGLPHDIHMGHSLLPSGLLSNLSCSMRAHLQPPSLPPSHPLQWQAALSPFLTHHIHLSESTFVFPGHFLLFFLTVKIYLCRTSLMVQWLIMCLTMQGMQVQSLVRELRSHMQLSLWATSTEPACHSERVYVPQKILHDSGKIPGTTARPDTAK